MAAGLRLPWKSKREKALEHRKLRQEQDLLRSLSQASVAYFVAVMPDYKIYYLNPAVLKALGYRPQELIGRDYLTTIVLKDDIEKARQGLENCSNSKQAYIDSYRILTKAGEPLEIEWRNRPVLKVNGELDYVLNIGVDVTERRKSELPSGG